MKNFWISVVAVFVLGYLIFVGVREYEYQVTAKKMAVTAIDEALDVKLGDKPCPTIEKIDALPEGRFKMIVREELKAELLRRYEISPDHSQVTSRIRRLFTGPP